MKRTYTSALLLLLLFCLSLDQVLACTTFCLKSRGEVIFGKNYDWMIGDGLVVVNKRGVRKTSTLGAGGGEKNPAKWVSRYGSVTFNQYGRENPMGGMNEAGLVIELMWLDETRYPAADERATVDVLEWVQYQLDTAASVAEVLRNAETLRVTSEVKIHYLVNDRQGNSATVEFLDGKLVARSGSRLTVPALANDTYDKSLDYANRTPPEKASTASSFDRFTRAARRTREFEKQPAAGQQAVAYAFDTLADVAQPGSTQWSIVYDQGRGKIHFRTMRSPEIKSLDARAFDYACASPVKIFDVNAEGSGDVTAKFVDYTRPANRGLIERSFGGTPFLKGIPPPVRNFLAAYPESFTCEAQN